MAKSQQPPPLAQRVAEELELVQRVAKGRATWANLSITSFGQPSKMLIRSSSPSCASRWTLFSSRLPLGTLCATTPLNSTNRRVPFLHPAITFPLDLPSLCQTNLVTGQRPSPALPPLYPWLRLVPPSIGVDGSVDVDYNRASPNEYS
ncbi:hypothetical protein K3495_g13535 [Podosphaera aphanis]|nr:hypothetical protein K3495_g13535 [Podosphaera aphanis]